MGKPKRTAYTALGFVVWKGLAVVGVKAAKDKVAQHVREERTNEDPGPRS